LYFGVAMAGGFALLFPQAIIITSGAEVIRSFLSTNLI